MSYNNYLIKNVINNTVVYNLKSQTILQACMGIGIEIPRYCFHNRLSIAGNCRMCLVEVFGSMKPVASCAQKVASGNIILTNSELVKKIREGINEFLLYNHPLDCAICDQGGECDLQDQSMVFGSDMSRFFDTNKRVSYDKECGPLIKTVMTRCIHCTRCVRFLEDVVGTPSLSVLGRGQTMEIGSYLDEVLNTELSGNLIDLCPVGALTSKPSASMFRSWELKSIESIDVFDNLGSNIRIDTGFSDIVRITPVLNESLNEEWISDKIRFAFDGLSTNRIGGPMKRVSSQLVYTSWKEMCRDLFVVLGSVSYNGLNTFNAYSSVENDSESLFLLKNLVNFIGSSSINSEYNISDVSFDFMSNVSFNNTFSVLSSSDNVVLNGLNLKLESPVLNLKLRKKYLQSKNPFFLVGTYYKSNYPLVHISNSYSIYNKLLYLDFFTSFLFDTKVLFLFNNNISNKSVLVGLFNKVKYLFSNVSYHFISTFSNYVGWANLNMSSSVYNKGLNSGFNSFVFNNKSSFNYFYNINNTISKDLVVNSVNILQGHHGVGSILDKMDYVLPSLSFIEKKGSYFNVFNDRQFTSVAFTAPKFAKNDSEIFKFLFLFVYYIKKSFSYDFSGSYLNSFLKEFCFVGNTNFLHASVGSIIGDINNLSSNEPVVCDGELGNGVLYSSLYDNFYNTNLITYSSKIMGISSKNLNLKFNYYLEK